jgi:hypothetical protein
MGRLCYSSVQVRTHLPDLPVHLLICNTHSVVETGISVICSSLPTLAKFSRLHIWETGYMSTLRSLLRFVTGRSTKGSSKAPSKSRSFESTPKASPKKFDPYSINMPPTTNASVTQLTSTRDDYIEFGDATSTRPYPEIWSSGPGGVSMFGGQGIQRTLSVEQQHEDKIAPTTRDMV